MNRRLAAVCLLVTALLSPAAFADGTLFGVLTGSGNARGNLFLTPIAVAPPQHGFYVALTTKELGASIAKVHLHEGLDGPIVADLTTSPEVQLERESLIAGFLLDEGVARRLLARPQTFYIDVHTAAEGPVIVRAQLGLADRDGMFAELAGPSGPSRGRGVIFAKSTPGGVVTYEVLLEGVSNVTGIEIRRNDPSRTVIATLGVPQNGRLSGTLELADFAVAQELYGDSSDFFVRVNTQEFPSGAISGVLEYAYEYHLPIVGRVTNGAGQLFVTDARIVNLDEGIRTALLEYFPANTGNNGASITKLVPIPASGTLVYDDIMGPNGLNATGTGALRVTASEPLVVTSRIYLDQRPQGKGTFGQFSPSKRAVESPSGWLPQLSHKTIGGSDPGYRTNIGIFNPAPVTVTTRLELKDANGALVARNTITSAPHSQQQRSITDTFPGVDFSNRPDLTLSYIANGPVDIYASVVDNVSGDQIFVSPAP